MFFFSSELVDLVAFEVLSILLFYTFLDQGTFIALIFLYCGYFGLILNFVCSLQHTYNSYIHWKFVENNMVFVSRHFH